MTNKTNTAVQDTNLSDEALLTIESTVDTHTATFTGETSEVQKTIDEYATEEAESPAEDEKQKKIDLLKQDVTLAISNMHTSEKHFIKSLIALNEVTSWYFIELYLKDDTDLCPATRSKCKKIFENKAVLGNIDALPNSLSTLYEISTKLDDKMIAEWMDDGRLSTSTTRADFMKEVRKAKKSNKTDNADDNAGKEKDKEEYFTLDGFHFNSHMTCTYKQSQATKVTTKQKQVNEIARAFFDKQMEKFLNDLGKIVGGEARVKMMDIFVEVK